MPYLLKSDEKYINLDHILYTDYAYNGSFVVVLIGNEYGDFVPVFTDFTKEEEKAIKSYLETKGVIKVKR